MSTDDGFLISTPGQTGTGDANFKAGILFNDVGIFVRALDLVSDTTVLSNPKVLTLNRQRARVHIGDRQGYLETVTVENTVLQTVKFINSGIELDIRPFIMGDGRVRLEIAPEVSSVTFGEGVRAQIPDEKIQTISTDVLVPAGHTAVLGGLFTEMTTRSRSQVPILGDIPLLGVAFRGHEDTVEKVEIIFLIKPTILKDRLLDEQGERGVAYEERVRVGSRRGLLPWSRERQTSRLNLEAVRLMAKGEVDSALFEIRRSLELNPNQPDAIRIREELVGDREWWPMPSMLDRIIGLEHARDFGNEPEASDSAPQMQPSERDP